MDQLIILLLLCFWGTNPPQNLNGLPLLEKLEATHALTKHHEIEGITGSGKLQGAMLLPADPLPLCTPSTNSFRRWQAKEGSWLMEWLRGELDDLVHFWFDGIQCCMSRLNASQQQSIARIITECDELTRQPSRATSLVVRTLSLTKHASNSSIDSCEEGRRMKKMEHSKKERQKGKGEERKKKGLMFFKTTEGGLGRSATQLTYRGMSTSLSKHKKQKPQFCGEVNLSRRSKAVFFQIVDKFKKSYYPTNASRGESDTSEMKQKTPREVTLYRNQPHAEQHASQLRRLAILSRVITENTRKEAKLMRERCGKSHIL